MKKTTKKRDVNPEREKIISEWIPKTELGKKVMAGKIKNLEELFATQKKVMESEIIDSLTELQEKTVSIRKTTKVVRAGRKFSFSAAVLVGNGNGYIGIGTAKDKERWPAIRKATKKAKLSLTQIRRGCGSWQCTCGTQHSVPFRVKGKSASVRVELLPAPKGTGLVAGDNIKDVLKFAGITDVWVKTRGATDTTLNFVRAAIDALKKTTSIKLSDEMIKKNRNTGKKGKAIKNVSCNKNKKPNNSKKRNKSYTKIFKIK